MNELTVPNRETIIAKYPLFCLLNQKDIHELALVAKEEQVDAGTVLTREGDIVDKVYLIVSGTAKVMQDIHEKGKSISKEIATLKNGDAIGLASTGFFSREGIRTATVIAVKPMVLLSFDLRDFQIFLQRPGVAYPAIKNTGDKIILMNFIQQSNIFKDFSIKKTQQLAKSVKKMALKADKVLYKEGEMADAIYFIISGSISTLSNNGDGKLAKLYEPYSIIGEDEFIQKTPRQSIARAESDCELFVLERRQIVDVEIAPIEKEDIFSSVLTKIKIKV